jgi:hypothetical protein
VKGSQPHATGLGVVVACAAPAVKSSATLSTTSVQSRRGGPNLGDNSILPLLFSIVLPPAIDYKPGLPPMRLAFVTPAAASFTSDRSRTH